MEHTPVTTLASLLLLVFVSEWLVRHTVLRALGSALLVIVLAALAANLGAIPRYGPDIAVYDAIFGHVVPVAIFLLLLQVDLRRLLQAGPVALSLFLIGSAGTFLGVILGMTVIDGASTLGDRYAALGGMFVGTYTGGSVNFNAVAASTGFQEEGALFAGATAVDSLMTTLWMIATLAIPKAMRGTRRTDAEPTTPIEADPTEPDAESLTPRDAALLLALALVVHAGSAELEALTGVSSILILTSVALVLAQIPLFQRLKGPRVLGLLGINLFLAVIGALCDVEALAQLGSLGGRLFVFVAVIVVVHGLILFGAARAFRLDPDVAAVASQANIGGGTTALALARSLGRPDLELPAILIGSLGNAIGTFLGVTAVRIL